jgi:type IV fimbrial biogenesis protein FimT
MKPQNGFTLVELLITIVVLTVLMALGVPAFKEFIKNNRLTAQSSDLVIALQQTRSEAVKRHAAATICASTDQASCDVTDNDWTNGWIIFSDLDQDGTPDLGTNACLEAEDCIMRTSEGLAWNNTLIANTNQIVFYPTGLVRDIDVPAVFTLTASDCYQNQVRSITVNVHGHTSIAKMPCP